MGNGPRSGILLLLTIAGSLNCAAQDPRLNYRFRHFTINDGLAHNVVFSIAQDSLGYLWLGAYNGPTQFDGYRFKAYTHNPAQPDTEALDWTLGPVLTDRTGNLWLGPSGNPGTPILLASYDRKADGFVKHQTHLDETSLNLWGRMAIRFDEDNRTLWIGTLAGLYKWDKLTQESTRILHEHAESVQEWKQNFIRDVADLGSYLLLATRKGLWEYDKKSGMFSRPECSPADSSFFYDEFFLTILAKPSGRGLWLRSSQLVGYKLTSIDSNYKMHQRFSIPIESGVIAADEEEIVWIGNDTELVRFNAIDSSSVSIRHIPDDPYSLLNSQIRTLLIDRERNLWIGTEHGLSLLKKSDYHLP